MNAPVVHDDRLDERLRRTLAAVAATVHEEAVTDAAPAPTRSRRRRRLLVGAGVTIAAIPLAAAAVVRFGPEYVDRIPPADPIVSGTLDGERYWVADGREIPPCEKSPSGVELIVESHNLVGREWNTIGAVFGEPTANGCPPVRPDEPPAHTYYDDGGMTVGDGMLWLGALHPAVDEVQVSLDGAESFDAQTFEHEGDAYYVLEVPPGTDTFTLEYVDDGQVVEPPSGEHVEHVVPAG